MRLTSPHRLAASVLVALVTLGIGEPVRAQGKAGAPKLPEGVEAFQSAAVNGNTWYGRFGLTNCGWIDLGVGVMVIDTGASGADAENLIAEIKRTTNGKPIRWIVMTHTHSDSNNGLPKFLPSDVTIFLHERASTHLAAAVAKADVAKTDLEIKTPTIVGVASKVFVVSRLHTIEIGAMPGHTDNDLYVYSNESSVMFVGDIITPGTPPAAATKTAPAVPASPGRCPMMSDPTVDPNAWLVALDTIEAHHPAVIIPTRGNASPSEFVDGDVKVTRKYIQRILDLAMKAKKGNYPDSRVSGELSLQKLGDYCPSQLDAINALSVYHRISADGTTKSSGKNAPATKAPASKRMAPDTKKTPAPAVSKP